MAPDSGDNSQLAGVVVCIAGDPTFDKDKNKHIREQCTAENIGRWLKYRSGRLSDEVTKATTHLICSRNAYKNRAGSDKIKAARKLGCHIVTYEWLTDHLQLLDHHKRKAPPALYHPGEARDGEAISALFKKSEKKARLVKEKAPSVPGSADVSGGDDATAATEAAGSGSEHVATSAEEKSHKSSEKKEKKESPKSSDFAERKVIKVVDDIKSRGNPVDSKSDMPAGKSKDGAKVENHEPRVDLSRFTIYRDESGPYHAEVFYDGRRYSLELYESKSTPKTYLFGIGVYRKQGSSTCVRRFPSKTPRDRDHELQKFRSRYWRSTGKVWPQRESNPRNGPSSGRQPRPLPKTTVGIANHKNKFDELGKVKKNHPTKSLAVPHRYRQADMKTAFKRKGSSLEKQPAKELKVTKYSVAGGTSKATNTGSKTA